MSNSIKSKLVIALGLAAKLIVTLLFISTLPACTTTKPATFAQKDPHANLYAYKTFAFFPPAAGQDRGGYSTLVGEQLKAATAAQMERLGYVYDARNPDLRVNITLVVQQRAEVRSTPVAGPRPYRAWGVSNVETVEYRQGTLAIDLVDAQRRTMVWRGVAQDRITQKQIQKSDETIRAAVREVFTNYPRKAA